MDGFDGDFTKEFKSCQQELFRYAFHLTKNREQADDLIGNAWYKYLLNIEKINSSQRKFWLLRVIYNEFIDSQRKKKRWRLTSLSNNKTNSLLQTESIEEALEKKVEKENLLAIIASLEFPYREVIFHFYFSEMSVTELQAFFGMNSSQIKTILYRGRKKIKERILNG
ncbi:sigma-70 family RNA polymerase sigma factor [Enterococcus sp. BWT-B8]|uniref:RNA polymerase sigma factor n=1 Tax=Enterococcus sp. BWT-B8 TaxID=2885157 RepID=UPI001E62C0C0|nr:sigma-70 family RNA polymerase sigma factor [Enterococcus sp. BWT-B8]MCB5950616.1 sigma-70 family RNA polymerase sigma factor [Enterococcus sp. BWT-B8]